MGTVRLLLDTCAFLWLAQEPDKISSASAKLIDDQDNELFLSDVSILEIVMKNSAGKLPLPAEPEVWISDKMEFHQLTSIRLSEKEIFLSGKLPRVHNDPFDRLLVAQAILNGMTLLSPDIPMSKLGASQIW
jgi:PIN domain nuclease of toxin-antitoxin system